MSTSYDLFKRVILFLTAAIMVHVSIPADAFIRNAQSLDSPYVMTAEAYLDLAKNQTGIEKQALTVMAAGRLIQDGQLQQGSQLLSKITPLSPELASEMNLLLAKVDLMRQQSKSAITKLSSIRDLGNMPLYYQVQYHEMLASAYRSTGHELEAINERIKLEPLLPDERSQSNNRRALWLMLITIPMADLNAFSVEAKPGSVLGGWLALAVIARQNVGDVSNTVESIAQWKQRYSTHTGNYILPNPLSQVMPLLFPPPKQVALLLPLTGKLAGPGNAVRDGFISAFDAAPKKEPMRIKAYDTEHGNIAAIYQQAIVDGAEFVVGPLGKADVSVIASLQHPVPTLLLNDLNQSVKPNAYFFGLSPTNEARQVAARARKQGRSKALVIAPSGNWGDEVAAAFAQQFTSRGGRIVDTLRYEEGQNLAPAIKQLLHAVEEPKKRLGVKPKPIDMTARRRQDADMIFLLAYPSKARQIMPMLRYFYAGNIPVYSTSVVYSGDANAQQDRDLDGILFCDTPWVFNHQMQHKQWPEQWNSYNRLFALGVDSFMLTTQLNQLLLFPATSVNDKSGVLYLTMKQQIARILVWGKFKQGLPQQMTEGN